MRRYNPDEAFGKLWFPPYSMQSRLALAAAMDPPLFGGESIFNGDLTSA